MINKLGIANVRLTGGFWKAKQDMVRNTTVKAVYDRFCETGRFEAFKFNWKEGEPHKPHIFWDSDVAKWVEGVAYLTQTKRESELERIVDELVELIEEHQDPNGYFNIYFTVVEPERRFQNRNDHELYCAGHLMEAAVAYFEATGKRKFLNLMCRYADHIEKRFKLDRDTGFTTPGHEEIELALVRLSECTGEKRYMELAEFFINERGCAKDANILSWCAASNNQSHLPVREQRTAEGHAVRAVYLYSAMADIALRTGDSELRSACEAIFDDIIEKKMYITGGIGSSSLGEAFTLAYDLSNLLAYTETCAAIGLAFFANRMLGFGANSKYSDTVERIMYNGSMSSVSLDGKAFFYENPLEVIPYLHRRDVSTDGKNSIRWPQMTRSEVFSCSCCPPNIVRFIPSIADMFYGDDGETVYVHQYGQSTATVKRNGSAVRIDQNTAYPENGRIEIKVNGGDTRLAVRIPGWYDGYKGETVNGYAFFDVKDGQSVTLDFEMRVKFIEARPEAVFDCGRYAVMRGPVVYCMEGKDNGELLRDIRVDSHCEPICGTHPELGTPTLTAKAYRRRRSPDAPLYSERHDTLEPITATLIPYYAFANRGESEMQIWCYLN